VSDLRIEPLTDEHIDQLMPYEREMFGPEAWSASSYRAELGDRVHKAFIAAVDEDGVLLGWAGVVVNGDSADIMTVGTVPADRRRGIGTALVHALLDEAVQRGAREVLLEVRIDNDAARALYEREGFMTVGLRRGYYDHGRVDGLTMHRPLRDQHSESARQGPAGRVDHD
jgi:ribosomal-protein-alanine N-acetyltransferase